MINSDKYFTIIYRDLTVDERRNLLENSKVSASGYSHAFDDRDGLLSALVYLEDFLTSLIDLIVWPPSSETKEKLQKEIADIQKLLKMHGRLPKNRPNPEEKTMEIKHPITPSTELVQKWINEENGLFAEHLATQAARWGADQELDECCNWLRNNGLYETRIGHLREARRRKPLTLKEQALEILSRVYKDPYPCNLQEDEDWDTIRRALEELPNE